MLLNGYVLQILTVTVRYFKFQILSCFLRVSRNTMVVGGGHSGMMRYDAVWWCSWGVDRGSYLFHSFPGFSLGISSQWCYLGSLFQQGASIWTRGRLGICGMSRKNKSQL